MLDNVEVFCHNSIKISGKKIIYIDPFGITAQYKDADYIFSTHSHYDHFSEDDIEMVMNENTIIITPDSSRELAYDLTRNKEHVMIVEPDKDYELPGVKIHTVVAFNKEKMYHQRHEGWVGYILEIEGVKYYIAGDMDDIKELKGLECDVAFLPIGGKYTMDYKEAAVFASKINAKIIVPTHYGMIVGEKEDAEKFKELITDKEVRIMIK